MKANDLAQAEALKAILIDWSNFMKGYEDKSGYPKKSAGFSMCTVVGSFEDMCDHADHHRNEVVDSCIDDLELNEKAAIYHRYLASVYRMRNYEETLLVAHEKLLAALKKKGMIW